MQIERAAEGDAGTSAAEVVTVELQHPCPHRS